MQHAVRLTSRKPNSRPFSGSVVSDSGYQKFAQSFVRESYQAAWASMVNGVQFNRILFTRTNLQISYFFFFFFTHGAAGKVHQRGAHTASCACLSHAAGSFS